jgi:hypothetical protein
VLGERQVHALGIELLGLSEIEEILEHAPGALRCGIRPRELEAVAAVVDADPELPLDLAQVLVELAADARKPARIVRRQDDRERRLCRLLNRGFRCVRQRICASRRQRVDLSVSYAWVR